MKIVGLRQSPVSSSSAPRSSEPASDGKVSSGVLRDLRLGGHPRPTASGSSMRTGGSHSDNCQTMCYRPKNDGFEQPGMVKVQATRGGIGTGRGSDNVMLSEDGNNGGVFRPKHTPGTWTQPTCELPAPPQKPIRSIGDLLRRLFEALKPTPAPAPGNPVEGGPGLLAPPSKPGSRLEQLLERLFPRGFPGQAQVMGRVDKPGQTHANNVLLDHHPGRDRNVL